ncbi:MAG: NTP transferase domain-containing protein, partial [Candidatus Binatia bacterium]|nr:NTP transferase domain-containing protein [Candidatus Binatia bacterium]
MPELYGVIPAAGRGVRAYPYTKTIPKSLLEVDGTSLLERNVLLLRDQLAISKIAIVVGHLGAAIRDHLGDGSRLGVEIVYVEND